jgi:hypothetical protein
MVTDDRILDLRFDKNRHVGILRRISFCCEGFALANVWRATGSTASSDPDRRDSLVDSVRRPTGGWTLRSHADSEGLVQVSALVRLA